MLYTLAPYKSHYAAMYCNKFFDFIRFSLHAFQSNHNLWPEVRNSLFFSHWLLIMCAAAAFYSKLSSFLPACLSSLMLDFMCFCGPQVRFVLKPIRTTEKTATTTPLPELFPKLEIGVRKMAWTRSQIKKWWVDGAIESNYKLLQAIRPNALFYGFSISINSESFVQTSAIACCCCCVSAPFHVVFVVYLIVDVLLGM